MNYRIFQDGDIRDFTQGDGHIRIRNDGGYLKFERKLTALAFAGVENIDWEWADRHKSGNESSTGVFRIGQNGVYFQIQEALTSTGFTGIENIDWEWLIRYKPE